MTTKQSRHAQALALNSSATLTACSTSTRKALAAESIRKPGKISFLARWRRKSRARSGMKMTVTLTAKPSSLAISAGFSLMMCQSWKVTKSKETASATAWLMPARENQPEPLSPTVQFYAGWRLMAN
ncbi:hypothetical protein [Klebsiella phage vB_KshKPC-M]|nr:hypothetical protein [Klebsiella phage vB_KshKPC-M]